MDEIGNRLAKAREHAGYGTARDAARSLGINVQTYAGHENGHGGIKVESAIQYAKKFGVNLDWLLTGRGDMLRTGVVPIELEQTGLPVVGRIQAGHWLDVTVLEPQTEEFLPVARDPRYPRVRQYALQVLGDSMNIMFPEGSYVTCIDFAESGLPLRDHMVVHVERRINGGQLVEITLKVVETHAGRTCLVPKSTNPAWFPYYIDASAEDTEVVVKGLVTGKYERLEL